MRISVQVKDIIHFPVKSVFEAIIFPDQMTGYFASHASGPLKTGSLLTWKFEDVGAELRVKVIDVVENNSIVFEWMASGQLARVEMQFEALTEDSTNIEIKEGPFLQDSSGIQKALQQTQGWTDFVCSLKAYLYTGVNLRHAPL